MAAILALTWHVASAGDPSAPPRTAANDKESIMRRKLVQAQTLLEGLALDDFGKLKAAADELTTLRQKAEWMALKTREYEIFTNDFQRHIEAMQKAAKQKNIDAATLAYLAMTQTCVHCHQYVREVRLGLSPTRAEHQFTARR